MSANVVPMETVAVMPPQDVDMDVDFDAKPGFRSGSQWSASTQMSLEAGDSETDGLEGDTPSSGPDAEPEDSQGGIDEDEYYAFLREMGCSFDGDEQDLSDDEEGSCSGSEDEDDDVPESTVMTAPKGVAPAASMDDLPAFEGLEAAGCSQPQGAQSFLVKVETQNLDENRLGYPMPKDSPFSPVCTPIAPGPSIWLLQALKVASAATATTM